MHIALQGRASPASAIALFRVQLDTWSTSSLVVVLVIISTDFRYGLYLPLFKPHGISDIFHICFYPPITLEFGQHFSYRFVAYPETIKALGFF